MNLLTTRFDPFDELTTLRNRMDRLFNRFGYNEELDQPVLAGNWMPTTDIQETKDALILKAELPGVDEKDINVEIENNVLTINGERKQEAKTEEKGYERIERSFGKFYRAFTLPTNVDATKILAQYQNGVLNITLPKREEAKPKKVHIEIKRALTSPKAA